MSEPEFVITADGPMRVGSSPELLTELLDEYKRELVALQPNFYPYDEAVPVSEEIPELLRSAGITPNPEMLVWFNWMTSWDRQPSVLPRCRPATVPRAIQAHQSLLDHLASGLPPGLRGHPDLDYGAGEGWLRLDVQNYGVAIECGEQPGSPPRIRLYSVDFYDEDTAPLQYCAVSMCTVVTWWLGWLRSGITWWDGETGTWKVNDASVPQLDRDRGFIY